MMKSFQLPHFLFFLMAIFGPVAPLLHGQTTAFTYQGWLTEGGNPANGNYEFQFRLTQEDGTAVGNPITRQGVAVASGAFTLWLDFGLDVFDGNNRWLEVSVRSNPEVPFTPLLPRQPVTSAPYAIRAATAGSVSGTVDASQISGTLTPSAIAPGSINSDMLADGAVDTAKLAPGSFFNGFFEGSAWNATDLRARELQDEVLVGWHSTTGSFTIPSALSEVVSIVGGTNFVFGIRSNGTVIGMNSNNILIQPEGFTNITRLATTENHLLGLRADGTVVSWGGDNPHGQLDVPQGLNNVVGIAAGAQHSLALRGDGSVVGWGWAPASTVPANLPPTVAIAAGGLVSHFSLALLADGTVRAWGDGPASSPPTDLANVVAIAAGDYHALALKSDGTVVAWGSQTTTPPGLIDVVKIATSDIMNIAIKRDGSVINWIGTNVIATTPASLPPASDVAVTLSRAFALVAQPTQLTRANANNTLSGNNTFSGSNTFTANNTFSGGTNTFTGSLRVTGTIRAGTESGTTDGPNPAGMITRRVNSTTTTAGAVVAIASTPGVSNFQLQRDGTHGGFRLSYPANAQVSVAAMGMDGSGTPRNFYQRIAGPAEAGFVQIYTDASNVVHFQLTFGDVTAPGRHITTVTLTRTPGGSSWFGHMVSNTSQ